MKIISIGKKTGLELKNAIEGYSRRLQGQFKVEWVLMPNSPNKGDLARSDESDVILGRLKPTDFVILLDERGENITSHALSEKLQANLDKEIVFVIGGAYGVNEALRQRADFVWSLSKLVFPHQIVRLILIEQIYRAQTIMQGHPYHHE